MISVPVVEAPVDQLQSLFGQVDRAVQQIETLRQQLATEMQQGQALRIAAAELVRAIDVMHQHPAFQHVFEHYQNCGLTYRGPRVFTALRRLRDVLNAQAGAELQAGGDTTSAEGC